MGGLADGLAPGSALLQLEAAAGDRIEGADIGGDNTAVVWTRRGYIYTLDFAANRSDEPTKCVYPCIMRCQVRAGGQAWSGDLLPPGGGEAGPAGGGAQHQASHPRAGGHRRGAGAAGGTGGGAGAGHC